MSYNKFENYQDFIQKYEIDKQFSKHINFINKRRLILIIDDSGSMNKKTETGETRWEQVKSAVKIIIKLANHLDTIDIYFLNSFEKLKVKSFEEIEYIFDQGPAGVTPLNRIIEKIKARYSRDFYNNSIIVLTDGPPTNSYGYVDNRTLKQTIKYMDPDKYFFIFFSFSEDPQESIYLNAFFDLPNVQTIDYYYDQRNYLRHKFGAHYNYSFGDHIVRGLLLPHFPEFNNIDIQKKRKCIIL